MALELLGAALACYLVGAAVAAASVRWTGAGHLAAAAGVAGAVALVATALGSLGGDRQGITLPSSTPLGGFMLRTAPLPGFFMLLVGLVGAPISIYTAGYAEHVGGRPRQAALHGLLNLSLASIALLLAAGNAFTFLVAWELMSILTYVLVTLQFDLPGRPTAAFLMLALGEVGFVSIALGFAFLGALTPGRDFGILASSPPASAVRDGAFLLFLFGFGAKAGLVPLQGWLPEAHPAAPGSASALLSAVVVTMALYGLVLTQVELLGPPANWWGYSTLALGVVTSIYGVLFSLLAFDLKRALAFSTVENLGFMVTMLGVAQIFAAVERPALVGAALVVAMLHALYHGLLKGTLFLGAGGVDVATGTRDMDQLGGLARRLPWTFAAFFVGATGLAGIPPLNGFQTEWLGLQVLIRSHDLPVPAGRVYLAAAGAILALTFALAVTTYIRIVAGVFGGAARSRGAREATEVAPSMRLGMLLGALTAAVLALLPPLGIGAAAAAVEDASGLHGVLDSVLPPVFRDPQRFAAVQTLGGGFLGQLLPVNGLVIVPTSFQYAFISPTYIFLTLALVVASTWIVLRLLGKHGRRTAPVWAGAVADYQPTMQYTATAFTNPLRFIFGTVYRSAREIEGDYHQAPFFARAVRYSHSYIEPVEVYLYEPIVAGLRLLARGVARLQSGSISLYLLYLFAAFLGALFLR